LVTRYFYVKIVVVIKMKSEETYKVDFVVVGSGIAGLRGAIELAKGGEVFVLCKDEPSESNTEYAQGGIAVALSDEDEVRLHFEDTIKAGDGLCNEEAVRILVSEGPRYITELIAWGTEFDREGTKLAFTKEAAHSRRRILHAHGDSTGKEIVRALLKKAKTIKNIKFLPRSYTIELITVDGRCLGVSYIDEKSGKRYLLCSRAVLLATGGCGRVYSETTNPPFATGDGMAIAFRAGAEMMDMEFVQFHPTSLFVPGAPRFLLSEALRGEGGLLRNIEGKLFMERYHPQAELAPRDVVSRAIITEMRRTGASHVFLDLTHLDRKFLRHRFPKIYETCLFYNIDITKDPIPVRPAAHYMMGGVRTDTFGRTSIKNLYAAGEVACTGVHGANRLASNSLLEGLVYGARAGETIIEDPPPLPDKVEVALPFIKGSSSTIDFTSIREEITKLMWEKVGIIRDGEKLSSALSHISSIELPSPLSLSSREALETVNIITVARLITRAALAREESRGGHYRSDFPEHDDVNFLKHSIQKDEKLIFV